MESLRRLNHASKGGGGGSGGGSRKLESGGGVDRRRLERRNATKHINYEHARPKRRADSESSFDESESSHSREDPYVLDEYRVLGKASVDEMNEVCRYFGLSGPDSLGITREDWSANRFQTSHDVIGADSLSSVTQDDPSDFTFVVSPPPSYLAPSAQGSLRDQMGRVNDRRVEEGSGNYGVTSPSSLRNDADAAEVGNTSNRRREEEQERVQECQSNRSPIGWRARSTSMPTCQNRSFSHVPTSLVFPGTPRQLLGNKIFEYPDPVTHIQRALSEPVVLPSGVNARSVDVHVLGEVKLKRGSILGSNNGSLQKSEANDRETVHERSADPASVVTGEDPMEGPVFRRESDSSSRSSSCSDCSGEYSTIFNGGREASRTPEQRSFEKKQDVGRAKDGAPSIRGTLSRPPPISLLNLPSHAFSTHDLLDGLGPPDASVAVVGRHNSELDSEDDERQTERTENEEVGSAESSTDDENLEGSNHKPQEHANEGRDRVPALEITVKSSGGKNAGDARAPTDDENTVEIRPSEIERNGERRLPSVGVKESTTSPTDQTISINLTKSPVPVEEEQDLRPRDDENGVHPLITFPWNKGDLLGAGSFGTVYEAFDSNGSFFAVKEVSLTDTDKNSQQCISQLEQEIELLSRFKHENIVQYLGSERADGKLYIFLELVSKGSLASLCKKFTLSPSQIIAYTRQILKGLKYLHDMNIVHRDIKCANILVDVKGTCKLADFGLAKQISALDQLKSCKGSAYWMAPEVIDPKKTYWLPADIWSLGCSVLEMFTGSPPFGDQEWYRVLWKVGHGEAPPIPDDLSDDAKDFIRQCLEVNPSKRPTATALLQHRFLSTSSTPTNSGHLNPQLVVSSLHTITEERTGDFTIRGVETYRTLGDSPLSNGHSGY